MYNIISYAYICYFLMDVRANRPDRAWVPWSIDSFENTLSSCTLHLISSHVLRYLIFSFGCSGEPVQSCLSSLEYRFLRKIQHIRVSYMHNIISYAYICYFLMDVRADRPDRAWVPWEYRFLWKYSIFVYFTSNFISCTQITLIFFWMFGANQSSRAWVPWSIDSFEKYSTFVYFTCIISSHIRIYLLFSYGCSGEPARSRVSSLEYRFLWKYTIFVYFTSDIISCTQISHIFFWMFGRTSPVVPEFLGV